MDASRRRRPSRALVIALAVSFGVHLAALPFLRLSSPVRASEPAHVIALESPPPFRIDPTPKPRPPTPPPPRIARATPPPRTARAVAIAPPPARAHSAHAPVESRSLSTARTGDAPFADEASGAPFVAAEPATGTPAALPQPEPPTSAPVPTPSDTPACASAPREASVLDAVTPERPALAEAQGATGHVEVRVDLTPSGSVSHASIYRTSGNASLDDAAVDAARHATYAPASDGCKPVGGSYVYTVDYSE